MSLPGGRHVVVVDLGYGDAGKGTVVDFLCAGRPVTAVIRFNGGAQAAHNVVTPDGRHHTFSQFGSGTLRGVPTHLSRFLVVDPLALAVEADHLTALGAPAVWDLLTIDAGALLTTPWHRAANRVREQRRGDDRHGSCGVGVGETMAFALAAPEDAPRVGDTLAPERLGRKLAAVRDRLTDELGELGVSAPLDAVVDAYRAFAERVSIVDGTWLERLLDRGPCVFEGAQGVLLDEWRGWHPYTTWSTTTFDNALSLLDGRDAYRLGVLRGYTVRHGPGPLVTEDPALDRPEAHNGYGRWQGAFRAGHFDTLAHAYALEVCGGADGLALTHLDAVDGIRMATAYAVDETILSRLAPGERGDLAYQEKMTAMLLTATPVYGETVSPAAVAAALRTPVVLESRGPTASAKRLA